MVKCKNKMNDEKVIITINIGKMENKIHDVYRRRVVL